MLWLTWRRHRKPALFALVASGLLAAVMVPTGLAMRAKFDAFGLGSCRAALGTTSMITQTEAVARCESLGHEFQREFGNLQFVAVLFVVLPALVGVFFGAPLVAREIEQGTHRLVWTQGVSRLRWALTTFGVTGAITAVLATGYALGVSWWFEPLVAASTGRLAFLAFDVQGIVPVAYTLFALALGIFAGTYRPRVVPSMALALAGYAVVRVAVEVLARPRYLPAELLTFPPTGTQTPNPASGDWILAQDVHDVTGRLVLPEARIGPCPPGQCAAGDVTNWLEYQPGDRFWTFQGIETAIFAVLTAALVFFAIRRIRTIA
ncbi:transporter [Amycolatopsis sp. NPDC049159]|uniref:transporter n=1 Tax=Amycolatopsis sp. NPDC049159 TaxID=3157210 RepID=UPI0033F71623